MSSHSARILGVSTGGYYAWRTRSSSQIPLADEVLMARIMELNVEAVVPMVRHGSRLCW